MKKHIKPMDWLRALLGLRDRMVGRLRFQHVNTCWRVWNLRDSGAWVFVGMLDKVQHEDDEHLTARAIALAERRHEHLEGV